MPQKSEREIIEEFKIHDAKVKEKKSAALNEKQIAKLDAEILKITEETEKLKGPEPLDLTVAESLFVSQLDQGNFVAALVGGGIGLVVDEFLGNENSILHCLGEIKKILCLPSED